jgi:hypothetical protein
VCPGAALWIQHFGDALDQTGLSVAADGDGNVVIAGAFEGTIEIGGSAFGAGGAGGLGLYVAKLDPSGNPLWSHAYPSGFDFVLGGALPFATVAAAPSGDVLFGGTFTGTVDFGTGAGPVTAVSAVGDGFIVAFDPAGNPRWSTQYSDPPPDPEDPSPTAIRPQAVESVAFDPSGNALGLGYRYVGTWGAMFLVKIDPTGQGIWRKDVSTSGALESTIGADGTGNVLVAGLAYAPIDFGGGPIETSPAFPTLFRAKLDPEGKHVWSRGAVLTQFSLHPGNGLGVDPKGNLFVAGAGTSIGFDVGCGLAPDAWGVKVLQFDAATGDCRWMWGFPSMGGALAVDAAGQPVLVSDAGDTIASCPDDGGGLPASACTQTFSQQDGITTVHGIAAAPDGRVLITGAFTGGIGFPGVAPVTSAGLKDVFVASF